MLKLKNSQSGRSGFTIVELLIVVVVIAILAAITIVAYNKVGDNARAVALKSDLNQSATLLENYKVDHNGSYPADQPTATTVLKPSSDTTFEYTYNSTNNSYLLSAYSKIKSSIVFYISSSNSVATAGLAPGHMGPPAAGWTPGNVSPVYTVSSASSYWGGGWPLVSLSFQVQSAPDYRGNGTVNLLVTWSGTCVGSSMESVGLTVSASSINDLNQVSSTTMTSGSLAPSACSQPTVVLSKSITGFNKLDVQVGSGYADAGQSSFTTTYYPVGNPSRP